jgi:hypothetical protein
MFQSHAPVKRLGRNQPIIIIIIVPSVRYVRVQWQINRQTKGDWQTDTEAYRQTLTTREVQRGRENSDRWTQRQTDRRTNGHRDLRTGRMQYSVHAKKYRKTLKIIGKTHFGH